MNNTIKYQLQLPWQRVCCSSRIRSVWMRGRASRTKDGCSHHPGRREWRLRFSIRPECTVAIPARRRTTVCWPSTPHPGLLPIPPLGPIAHSPPSALCPAVQSVNPSIDRSMINQSINQSVNQSKIFNVRSETNVNPAYSLPQVIKRVGQKYQREPNVAPVVVTVDCIMHFDRSTSWNFAQIQSTYMISYTRFHGLLKIVGLTMSGQCVICFAILPELALFWRSKLVGLIRAKRCAVQWSNDFWGTGTMYHFVLVINFKLGSIFHRFRDV